ncbi:MAG: DEAD/DEAH box helicase family protein, partial [Myxococcales bacterium]|nr:DEAD/DEAH box helicase family protein [Myxococcales bacterium]
GERGPDADDDPDPEYAERRAADYFLRRGLDLLTPGGIGVFVVPGGFLTGPTRALRRKVLLRHHLAAAFRMPPQLFPGTGKQLVIDVLVFRSRGGELSEVDEADTFILEGDYFRQFPNHDLSTQTAFTGLPPLVERPTCALCVVRPFQWKRGGAPRPGAQPILAEDEAEKALPPELRAALSIGRRVRRYHAAFAAGEPVAAEIFPELRADLDALAASTDTLAAVRKLATTGNINAEALAQSFDRLGNVALAPPGPSATRYSGLPQDVVAQAEALYKDRRRLTIDALLDFHRERGGTVERDEALRALFDADWNLDGARLDELVPLADYTTGDLWPKHDRLAALQNAPPQVARQLSRLREAIGPAEFVDIQAISPRQGWVPIELVGAWLGQLYAWGEPLALGRRKGLVQIEGTSYSELEDHVPRAEAFWAIGYLNHDPVYFRPKSDPPQPPGPLPPGSNAPTTPLWEPDPTRPDRDDKVPADEYRRRWIVFWEAHFYAWLRADAGRRDAIAEAYNRAFRGFVARQYSSEPLTIARWGDAITLERHQTMGARRILDQRGGLLAFDVGVGKTFTAVAVVARARQEGWARRPVVLVPPSLLWKWKRDFQRCLPDYRVAVIGSQRHRLTRGKTASEAKRLLAAGQISREEAEAMLQTSKPDTPQQRATKWRDFQAGAYDVVILSFDALPRTRVMPETVERYLGQTQEVLRSIELTLRSAAGKPEKDLTERQKAIKSLGLRGWFQNKLKTPKNQPPDPGIVWEELGVDLLVVEGRLEQVLVVVRDRVDELLA